MTLDGLIAVVSRIKLRNFPIPVHLKFNRMGLCVVLQVPERNTGAVTTMTHHPASTIGRKFKWGEAVERLATDDEAVDFVYDCVRLAVEHELQECFFVDGNRWRDPHPAAARRAECAEV